MISFVAHGASLTILAPVGRAWIYAHVSAVALVLALVLAGFGRRGAGRRALGVAGARPRHRAGPHRAAADLVVGAPDPRPVARRLAVPRGEPRLQQDVRRGPAPRDARRRRRVLLDRHRRLVGAWVRSLRRRAVGSADERLAWCVFVATIPAAIVGAAGEELVEEHLGEPWQIAISSPSSASSGSPTAARRSGGWAT